MVLIKGLQKTSLIDYEPYTSCVVFVGGCDFRCGYCHNPDLVLRFNELKTIKEQEFFSFLDSRKKWLDGVVVSGGEPTICKDLPSFIKKIKDKGFLVKLDTNGSNPSMIKELIDKKLVDYIAMDIKADLDNYSKVAGVKVDIEKIKKSISLIKESGINYEFRTTILPRLIKKKEIIKIAEMLKGSKKYVLQNFRANKEMIDSSFKELKPYSMEKLNEMKEAIKDKFDEVFLRG